MGGPDAQMVVDALPWSAAILDATGVIVAVNDAWSNFDPAGRSAEDLGTRYVDQCDEPAAAAVRHAMGGFPAQHLYPCHGPGTAQWFQMIARPMKPNGTLIVHVDVTEEVRLRRRVDALDMAFIDVGVDGTAVEISASWEDLTRQPRARALGPGWVTVFDETESSRLMALLVEDPRRYVGSSEHEFVMRLNGEQRWLELLCIPDFDGNDWLGWQISVDDVTDVVLAQQAAETDTLTGCAGRARFDATVADWMRDPTTVLAVCFLDLDEFKPVNDTHGHAVGDEVLRIVGRRLRQEVRDGDLVARYGGDEFVIGLRDVDRESLDELVERVQRRLGQRMVVDGIGLEVGASVGIAVRAPDDDVESVVGRADQAMYENKRERKRQRVTRTR